MSSNLKYFIVILVFITGNCHSYQRLVNQDYQYVFVDNETNFTKHLALFNNGQFKYNSSGELFNAASEGIWLQIGGKVFLSSDQKYQTGILSSSEKKVTGSGEISVKDVNGEPLSYAAITFDTSNSKSITLDQDGNAKLDDVLIGGKINIHYLGDLYSYNVKDRESNFFYFKLRLKDSSILYFKNSEWVLKKKKIISQDGDVFKLQKASPN